MRHDGPCPDRDTRVVALWFVAWYLLYRRAGIDDKVGMFFDMWSGLLIILGTVWLIVGMVSLLAHCNVAECEGAIRMLREMMP